MTNYTLYAFLPSSLRLGLHNLSLPEKRTRRYTDKKRKQTNPNLRYTGTTQQPKGILTCQFKNCMNTAQAGIQ